MLNVYRAIETKASVRLNPNRCWATLMKWATLR